MLIKRAAVEGDAGLLMLAANIAEPLADQEHALAWLEEASLFLPDDQVLAERIVRLASIDGLAQPKSFARCTTARQSGRWQRSPSFARSHL